MILQMKLSILKLVVEQVVVVLVVLVHILELLLEVTNTLKYMQVLQLQGVSLK